MLIEYHKYLSCESYNVTSLSPAGVKLPQKQHINVLKFCLMSTWILCYLNLDHIEGNYHVKGYLN